jgi:hypothetical protein
MAGVLRDSNNYFRYFRAKPRNKSQQESGGFTRFSG